MKDAWIIRTGQKKISLITKIIVMLFACVTVNDMPGRQTVAVVKIVNIITILLAISLLKESGKNKNFYFSHF